MLKKLLMGGGIAGVLTLGAIIGSLTLAPVFAHSTDTNPPAQAAVQSVEADDATETAVAGPDLDDVEEQNEVDEAQPQYAGSIQLDENQNQEMSEADEAAALQAKATISAAEAEAAALVANPGATVIKTELDNENGALVYSVELSNGSEVKVDAGTAKILHTETAED